MSVFLQAVNNGTSIYSDYCIWREIIKYNTWLTECGASTSGEENEGEAFIENHIVYCPSCGKKIKLSPFKRNIKDERDKWQNTATVLSVRYMRAFNAIKEIVDYAELDPDNDEHPVKIARETYNHLQEE